MTSKSHYLRELENHIKDCELSKMRHFDLSDIAARKMAWVSKTSYIATALILAWILSTQFKGILPSSIWLYEVLPVFIALFLAALNAFEAKAGYDRIYEAHLSAAQKYHALWRECRNWESDFPTGDGEEFHLYVKSVRRRLNDINHDSPHITIFQSNEITKFRKRNGWEAKNDYGPIKDVEGPLKGSEQDELQS
ncbi:MAG: SLATT domain-containing protein [Mangrovicoccus sp.]